MWGVVLCDHLKREEGGNVTLGDQKSSTSPDGPMGISVRAT